MKKRWRCWHDGLCSTANLSMYCY